MSKYRVISLILAVLIAIPAVLFGLLPNDMCGATSVADNYTYVTPVTATSGCSTNYTAIRLPMYISSSALSAGGYVLPDFRDILLAKGQIIQPLTATDITASTLYVAGTADSGSTTGLVDSPTLHQADNYWVGCTVTIVTTTDSLAPQDEYKTVTGSSIAGDNITFSAMTAPVQVGDTYKVTNQRSKWFTYTSLNPYESSSLSLYTGDPDAYTRDQSLCASTSDVINIPTSGSLNITDNLTLQAIVTPYDIPAAGSNYLIRKGTAYVLGIRNTNQAFTSVDTGVPNIYQPTTYDGWMYAQNANYAIAQSAANATAVDMAGAANYVGQTNAVGTMTVYRSGLAFDTSSLPDACTVTDATLKLWGTTDSSAADFVITIVDGQDIQNPMVLADYGQMLARTVSWGSINTATYVTGAWNNIPLNSTGLTNISLVGTTKFGLRSNKDITPTAPGTDEYLSVASDNDGTAGHRPRLDVTYSTLSTVSYAGLALGTTYYIRSTYDTVGGLNLYVNGTLQGNVAASGVLTTVTDNVTICSVAGLVDKLKIGNTSLTAPTWVANFEFEPNQISNIAITDTSPSVNNAVVYSWYTTLPSCLTVSVGALGSTTTWSSPGGTTGTAPTVYPTPTGVTTWMSDLTLAQATLLPMYGLFDPASTALGWDVRDLYRVMAIFTSIGIGVAVGVMTVSALLTAVAVGMVMALAVGAHILGWWIVFVYGILCLGLIVGLRSM